jgi:cytochrome o ubiquinol oxidase subunit 2
LLFAWWFRASNARARYQPEFVYSGRIEFVVWSIPTLVILFLGGVIWIGSYELDPAKALESDKKPLEIQAVSLDWKWLFIFPDQHVATINHLVVPVGTPLKFSITSASVFNVFFVPQLGSMIYAMNGMTTRLNLQADHEGQFHGLSAHFSGDGFPTMAFKVNAVSNSAFNAWVGTTQGMGPILDRAAYAELSRQSMNVPPSTFRAVEPNLFHAIVTQALPPGPGPEVGKPEPEVSPRTGG